MIEHSCNRWLILIILLISLVIFACQNAYCSPPCISIGLNKTFGGALDDELYSVWQTGDSGFILTGRTNSYNEESYDLLLIKTDKNGNILWQKEYGGDRDDEGYSVAETNDGGYVALGTTRSIGSGMSDAWILKVDQAGEKIWDKTFGGDWDDTGRYILQSNDGGYIFAGQTRSTASSSGSGMNEAWILKTDQFGNKVWEKTFGGPGDDSGDSIQQTRDGGFIIAGTTSSTASGDNDLILIKTDADGNKRWEKTFGGPRSELNPWGRGWSVQETDDGGYALVGSTNSFGSGGYDIWFVRTDADGDLIADETYGGGYDEEGSSIVKTTEGGYLLIGSTSSIGEGGYDAWLIGINQNGEKLWDQTFGSTLDDKGYSIQQIDDGYAFAGKTKPPAALAPRLTGCCDKSQKRESSYYDGWLVQARFGYPKIVDQPLDTIVCSGQEARFTASARGSEPFSYQWLKNGSEIAAASMDTYIIPAARAEDAGLYSVRVSNACGSVESDQAILAVNSLPTARVQPLYQTVCEGSGALLNAEVSGTEPLAYQWKKNGENIAGADNRSLWIEGVMAADGGNYSVAVSNICGIAESDAVIISVASKPSIEIQPIDQEACQGSGVSFSVKASGTESLTYQWRKNGGNITGANSETYSISAVDRDSQGNYSVIVGSDLCGWIESEIAELAVRSKPSILEINPPASQRACEGSDAPFQATAAGSGPLAFQWMKDGVEIPGASLGSHVVQNATTNDSGRYSLIASNDCGQIESDAVYLDVAALPEIQAQPTSIRVCQGSAATMAVQAKSPLPLNYQWLRDGTEISGATGHSYTIPAASTGDTGGYSVQISNGCGQIESNAAYLDITTLPEILLQPASQKACEGGAATFSVQASGSQPLAYQWLRDGIEIPGATDGSYTISAASTNDTAGYSVQISNGCGQIESNAAYLDVAAAPEISLEPASQKVCQGSPVTFAVQARGSSPLNYQWLKDGIKIIGATSEGYSILKANSSTAGIYSVEVSNSCGLTESDAASLEVNTLPSILVHPSSQKACQDAPVSFAVEANSPLKLTYQWLKDGTRIDGATASTFTIPVAGLSNAGRYSVQISNDCGQIESDPADLQILAPPAIVIQPSSQTVCEGSTATFVVQAEGSQLLKYQWLKDGIKIIGAESEMYDIPEVNLSDTGSYSVQVSNSCGLAESDAAYLDVALLPAILAQPSGQMVCEGMPVTIAVRADTSEPVSYKWQKDGVEIDRAASDSYTILAAGIGDTADYAVLLSTDCGLIQSDAARLQINSLPAIQVHPASQKVCQGLPITFAVQASSSLPLKYQWLRDGVEIAEATSENYTIASAGPGDRASYSVLVGNDCGIVESEAAYLEVFAMPEILLQPSSQTVCQGAMATISVQAKGSEPLAYQWLKDGIGIEGATAQAYVIPPAQLSDSGSYSVQISNGCGMIESEAAYLEVNPLPTIQVQPSSQTVCECLPVRFAVQATDSEPLNYQWLKDGQIIPGATSGELMISETISEHAGEYKVIISDSCGLIESNAAQLIVEKPINNVIIEPECQIVKTGESVSFRMVAVDAADYMTLSYQWEKNGQMIPGEESTSYAIGSVTADDAGGYRLTAGNTCGSVKSKMAVLQVIDDSAEDSREKGDCAPGTPERRVRVEPRRMDFRNRQ